MNGTGHDDVKSCKSNGCQRCKASKIGRASRARHPRGDFGDEEGQVLYLVDEAVADAAQSRISVRSPLARAILGWTPGQIVTFTAPGGKGKVRILDTGMEKSG